MHKKKCAKFKQNISVGYNKNFERGMKFTLSLSILFFSGPNDNIFLYFNTVGYAGLFLLPDDTLYADQFIPFIEELAASKSFKNVTLY